MLGKRDFLVIFLMLVALGGGYYVNTLVSCGIECEAKMSPQLVTVSPDEFVKAAKQKQAMVIDVRTAEEFTSGHVAEAVNQDFYQTAAFKQYLEGLDKNKPYLIYCRTGHRSGQVLEMMKEMGFTSVTNLDGGINAWQQAGLPIVK